MKKSGIAARLEDVMEYTKDLEIFAWSVRGIDMSPADKIKEWRELGLTLMIAHSNKNNWSQTHELLKEAETQGMRLIIEDWESNVDNLIINGEEYYRECIATLVAEFGSYPAAFGLYVTDEPGADNIDATLKAVRIIQEIAPHMTAYVNLLPWFDWIGERMGTDAYAPYLDRVVAGGAKVLSYDCYAQMYANQVGYDDYFNNLREHMLASKRNQVPFWNIVLCTGHYDYKCPSKDDLIWQMNTSVVSGAKGIGWFIIDLPDDGQNYRNAPINRLGERTPEFYALGEVNRSFNEYFGRVFSSLEIDECYHVNKAFGGMPLFTPFSCVTDVEERKNLPLIISSFHDSEGGKYFAICNNTTTETASVSLRIKNECEIERCYFGNRFAPPSSLTDPVGERYNKGGDTKTYTFFMAPGQIALFREK